MKTMICPACWGTVDSGCSYCLGFGYVNDVLLSTHFWLSEFLRSETASRKDISNAPTTEIVSRLKLVATDLLEPLRSHFGPIVVTSGYRSPELNSAIGGSSKTSVHPLGYAADFHAVGATRKQVVDYAIASNLPYDQVIFEGSWVHIGRFAPDGKSMRQQNLMMFPRDGRPSYHPYNPNDPRVST